MANNQSVPLSTGQGLPNPEGLQVTAAPLNLAAGPERSSLLGDFVSGLEVFNKGANSMLDSMHKQYVEQQKQQGVTQELQNPSGEEPSYTSDETPWAQQGKLEAWSKRKAIEASTEMVTAYETLKADPEKLRGTDLNAWTQDYVKSVTAGLKDPTSLATVYNQLFQAQSKIVAEGTAVKQKYERDTLVENSTAVATHALTEANFSQQSLSDQVAYLRGKGLSNAETATAILGAVRFGYANGNSEAGKILSTPIPEFNGLTPYDVATPAAKTSMSELLKVASAEERSKAKDAFGSSVFELFRKSKGNLSDETVQGLWNDAKKSGLTSADFGQVMLVAIEGQSANLDPADVNGRQSLAAIMSKPRAFLNGRSLSEASGDKVHLLTASYEEKTKELQHRSVEKAKSISAINKAGALNSLMQEHPEAVVQMTDEEINNRTINDPELRNTSTAWDLRENLRKVRKLGAMDEAANTFYTNGKLGDTGLSDEQRSKQAAHWERQVMADKGTSEPTTGDIVMFVQKAEQNKTLSPTVKHLMGDVSTMPAKVKQIDGKEIDNPELTRGLAMFQSLNDYNPELALKYAGSQVNYDTYNHLARQSRGETNVPPAMALERMRENAKPENKERLKAIMSSTEGERALRFVTANVKEIQTDGALTPNMSIVNKGDIEALAKENLRFQLEINGGNLEQAKHGTIAYLKAAAFGIKDKGHMWPSADEGYMFLLPNALRNFPDANRTASRAMDAKVEAVRQTHPGSPVYVTQVSRDDQDLQFQVYVGGIPKYRYSLRDEMVDYAKKQSEAGAAELNKHAQTVTRDPQVAAVLTGKKTPSQVVDEMAKENAEYRKNFDKAMAPVGNFEKDTQGNPSNFKLTGKAPTGSFKLASDLAVSDPSFAIGLAAEGTVDKPYRDNDGGVTIGLGYNTKHQMKYIESDFKEAGLQNTPGYISGVLRGEYRLTLPEQQALHQVAFRRFGKAAQSFMDEHYPGAWDKFTPYQKAAVTQLAYNTGGDSKRLKDFLTKVGQGQEEKAIDELRVVYHQNGVPYVNLDMMRLVRAMWQGPEVFKATLELAKVKHPVVGSPLDPGIAKYLPNVAK